MKEFLKILILLFLIQGCVTHYEACRNQGYRRGTIELTYCIDQRTRALDSINRSFQRNVDTYYGVPNRY